MGFRSCKVDAKIRSCVPYENLAKPLLSDEMSVSMVIRILGGAHLVCRKRSLAYFLPSVKNCAGKGGSFVRHNA